MNQPNILMIHADQMVAELMGVYGHPVVQTPNLNRLAEEGVRFDNFYTSCPICVPARASMLTGRYVSRIGCYDNGAMIPSDQPTLGHYLSIAGYDTVASGKLHLIGPDQLHGFQRRLTPDVFPSDLNFLPRREKGGRKAYAEFHANPIAIDYVTAGVRQWSMGLDFDEETHFRALEYLRSRRSQYTGTLQKPLPPRDERPFFLCVSYTHPHEPFHVTQEMWDEYEGKEIALPQIPEDLADREHPMDRQLNTYHGTDRVNLDDPQALYSMRRAYYALVTYVDRKVGELLKTLDDMGLRQDTLIIFLSDHGDMLGERRMVQKRVFYEYSARVPWIVSFPRRWTRGMVIREPVSMTDVMPTVLDVVGVPQESVLPIDGQSVVPLIEGQHDEERVVFSEIHSSGVNTCCFMVRQGDWKYIHVAGHPAQLYSLAEDPREWNNLAGKPECREIQNKLHGILLAHFDPDRIEESVQESVARRMIIRQAMSKTGLPKWDYQPLFDATKQYWREG